MLGVSFQMEKWICTSVSGHMSCVELYANTYSGTMTCTGDVESCGYGLARVTCTVFENNGQLW